MCKKNKSFSEPFSKTQGAPVPWNSSEDVGHTNSINQHLQREHLCLTKFRVSKLDSVCSTRADKLLLKGIALLINRRTIVWEPSETRFSGFGSTLNKTLEIEL